MKRLAFEYAGDFNMPSMKMVKIERENVMFANSDTPTSVFNYTKGSVSQATLDLALGEEISLASTDVGNVSAV